MDFLRLNRTPCLLAAAVLTFSVALVAFLGFSRTGIGTGEPTGAGGEVNRSTGVPRDTASRIVALQDVLRTRPRDAALWARLGQSDYQRVRETGDFAYYSRAQEVFNRARRLDPRNVDALVGLATIALARHDFRGGLRLARSARRLAPERNTAYPALVDGLVETGQYRKAGQVIEAFVSRIPTLSSYARVSYFRELHGDLGGAVSAMRFAVSAGGAAPENVAYVQTLLGDLEFLEGRISAAGASYELALAGVPDYPLAGVGLAQVEAARGAFGASIAHLRAVTMHLPLPQFVTALGEVELAAGRPAQARHDFALIGAEERLLAANGVNTDVDLALFEASHGDPRRGVSLGRRSWTEAPSVRSADALGWALTRAGHPRQGLAWARRALTLGSVDPNFLFHAGIAARQTGRRSEARSYLRQAVARNPRFSALYGPQAQRALRALR